jgi:hypothetical protein
MIGLVEYRHLSLAVAPTNDNLVRAIAVAVSASKPTVVNTTTTYASLETGEPNEYASETPDHTAAFGSVWHRVTVPANGKLIVTPRIVRKDGSVSTALFTMYSGPSSASRFSQLVKEATTSACYNSAYDIYLKFYDYLDRVQCAIYSVQSTKTYFIQVMPWSLRPPTFPHGVAFSQSLPFGST